MGAPSSDRAAIRQVIRALRKAGYTLPGGHNGEEPVTFEPDASEDTILAEMMACDDSTLYTVAPDGYESHVYFVLGNDPEEVVCDHGVSLSPILDPLTESWWTE
jgi:hypothetical protein